MPLKRVCLLLCVLLLLPVSVSFADAGQRFGVTYRGNTIELRSSPTQYAAPVASYAAGVWMEILGTSGTWYSVKAPDGTAGWVSRNYLQAASVSYGTVVYVNNGNPDIYLNLRSAPSYSADVLGWYYDGAPAMVLQERDGWYQVRIDNTEGWFRGDWLTVCLDQPVADGGATVITVRSTMADLRSGPGESYESVAQVPSGSYVLVLQQGTEWVQVSWKGTVGWIAAENLRDGLLTPARITAAENKMSGMQDQDDGSSLAPGYALVNSPSATQVVNLRYAPQADARIVGQYTADTRVDMLQQGTEWCRVRVVKNGSVGYMMTEYLRLVGLPEVPQKTVSQSQGTYVNLRSTPSLTEGTVLCQIPDGSSVTVIVPGETWTQVEWEDTRGYVMTVFLQ